MPYRFFRTVGAHALTALLASLALSYDAMAQTSATDPADKPVVEKSVNDKPPVENSQLDSALFYQLLIGQLELTSGELGGAYQIILDAARRHANEQLFRLASDVALQGRAGDQALVSIKAWRLALPESVEAMRYEVQLMVALKRPADTLEPLQALINLTPAPQRPGIITAVPLIFAQAVDRPATARLIEKILRPYVNSPSTSTAARLAIGNGWLLALDNAKAFEIARSTHSQEPTAEGPPTLALQLTPSTDADAIVESHLKAKPDSNAVRLLYVRSLLTRQRFADATTQLQTLTNTSPQMEQAWLTLGALHLQLREPMPAIAALQKYIDLVQAADMSTKPQAASGSAADSIEPTDVKPPTKEDALTRGWLLLSQAAEQQNDLKTADAYLAKIDNPQRLLEVQARRASLLAREGKVAQARELIRNTPDVSPDDARAKFFAEAQMLRDAKLWSEANAVLAQANQQFADDADLLYEQSMMLEKLNQVDEMERLLRRVITLKPEHQHAYNALGFSLAERNMRLPEAKTLIRKALELSPGEPAITDSLGWVEYRLGNHIEAVRLLREAYRSQPDAEIAAHLGEALWASGSPDEARRVWGEAKGRDGSNDVLRETLARLRVDL